MGSSQLDSLNSSIKIQSMNLDLMFNLFHKTSLRCHWLLIFCQLVKNFFPPWLKIYHGEGLMVTPTGHSHRNNYANFGRTWLTMKNHDNMHNLLRCTIVTKEKDFTAFSLGQLVAILTFCTVRSAPSPPFSSSEPLGLICNEPVALDATENTNFLIG